MPFHRYRKADTACALRSAPTTSMLAACLWLVLSAGAQGAPLVFASGAQQTSLLELYTSQGCSSCPPAESWLNEYTRDPGLWSRVVPLAWHVDYWDYIGWKDPFALPVSAQRQRDYARAGRTRTVYTPGMFLNGREWRGWTWRLPPAASGNQPGVLAVTIEDGRIHATFPAAETPLDLHVALLGSGIQTEVERGENRNRILEQDFIVLEHAVQAAADGSWTLALPQARVPAVARRAVALWITPANGMRVLQATGAWLDAASGGAAQ